MTENAHKHSGHDCPPEVDPADQPNPPGDGKACEDLPKSEPPELTPPEPCPDPDPCCKCPQDPPATSNCLETLIDKQTETITVAEQAKAFKSNLEAMLAKAQAAQKDYNQEQYEKNVAEWVKQDADIAELLRKLECAVWCWKCILECYVCPKINELRMAEKWLYGEGKLYPDVHNLYDLRYWHTQDKAAKDRILARITAVLNAWTTTPAKTIADVLKANGDKIESAAKVIGTEPGKAIFDVFMRLVPLHLAIAPPEGSQWTTKIDARFTAFCECDSGTPDDCCGPDVGAWSLRQRLIKPQPYLINPSDYYKLICCLIEKRYLPANDAASKAKIDLDTVEARIARYERDLNGLEAYISAATDLIPSVIDCCAYECDEDDDDSSQSLLS